MTLALPLVGSTLGWPELIIIVLVVLLLFGGKKLPEMARGTGRALRIFKAETKGLMDDDDDAASPKTDAQREIDVRNRTEAEPHPESERPGPDTTH
jgi:sec-independent protein translocase protein TatA